MNADGTARVVATYDRLRRPNVEALREYTRAGIGRAVDMARGLRDPHDAEMLALQLVGLQRTVAQLRECLVEEIGDAE